MRSKIFLILLIILAAVLRLYHLSLVPPSLYWDEASLGYNAYSISQTLHDEHGELLPLSRFMAFGDYKPPAYIYATALSIKIFGLSEFSVRFPSALSGIFLVLLAYHLTKELLFLKKSKYKEMAKAGPILAATFMAISPWALQFSRAAFEANLATLFSGLGILLFLRAVRINSKLFFSLSAISFALSLYTFNSHRVFVPAMIAALGLIFLKNLWRLKAQILIFSLLFVIVLLPLMPHLLSREGRLRFYEVTWLNDSAPILTSNQRIAVDGGVWWAKLLHNRRIDFSLQFLKHYSDHFRGDFLFFSGDVNPRLSIQTIGELYWLDLLFLLPGIFFLLRFRDKSSAVLLAWILLSPLPAATARETPHALRILQILPSLQIVMALGIVWVIIQADIKKYRQIIIASIATGYFLFMAAYLHDYYIHYPNTYASDWQYGYKQMVEYVQSVQQNYDHISVTGAYGRPYIYLLFYEHYDPQKYWSTRVVDRDWYGFWYVHGFDKFSFEQGSGSGKWLYVHDSKGFPPGEKLLKVIKDPNGNPVFQITEKT